jgi:hypothetical protein
MQHEQRGRPGGGMADVHGPLDQGDAHVLVDRSDRLQTFIHSLIILAPESPMFLVTAAQSLTRATAAIYLLIACCDFVVVMLPIKYADSLSMCLTALRITFFHGYFDNK